MSCFMALSSLGMYDVSHRANQLLMATPEEVAQKKITPDQPIQALSPQIREVVLPTAIHFAILVATNLFNTTLFYVQALLGPGPIVIPLTTLALLFISAYLAYVPCQLLSLRENINTGSVMDRILSTIEKKFAYISETQDPPKEASTPATPDQSSMHILYSSLLFGVGSLIESTIVLLLGGYTNAAVSYTLTVALFIFHNKAPLLINEKKRPKLYWALAACLRTLSLANFFTSFGTRLPLRASIFLSAWLITGIVSSCYTLATAFRKPTAQVAKSSV